MTNLIKPETAARTLNCKARTNFVYKLCNLSRRQFGKCRESELLGGYVNSHA